MAGNMQIDDSLYSRQRYVLGDEAMLKLQTCKVLICGVDGIGIEIAKNIVLAGPNSLDILDENICDITDLGTQYFINQSDIHAKITRANASISSLTCLNPNVNVNIVNDDICTLINRKCYNCVVLCNIINQTKLIDIDEKCRQNSIKLILAFNFGLMSSVFCDFGIEHEITDPTGEINPDIVISNISNTNPCVITCIESEPHHFSNSSHVLFKGTKGMEKLNNKIFQIKVLDKLSFSIDFDARDLDKFQASLVQAVNQTSFISHEPLKDQLVKPAILTCDLSNFGRENLLHIFFCAVMKFGKLPVKTDFNQILQIMKQIKVERSLEFEESAENLEMVLALCATSKFPYCGLCGAIGGLAAQEVLKSITNKFVPLNQWLHFECTSLWSKDAVNSFDKSSRYFDLANCIGAENVHKLHQTNVFMIGCGAIGCELMKTLALMGVGTGKNGKLTITDDDVIEKSNLNRQFLFRPEHVKKYKSLVAAESVKKINPDMQIDYMRDRVNPATEHIFNDEFWGNKHVILNALDNIDARVYVDSRCINFELPLLESGTSGSKGHVQVIYPHVTESYGSQRDQVTGEVPFCTLKSFPLRTEHVILWAKNKFASLFTEKPKMYVKFWKKHRNMQELLRNLETTSLDCEDNLAEVCSVILRYPHNWKDSVFQGRKKFDKYFDNKARKMLKLFPADHVDQDGTPFWKPPKRPPIPIVFDENIKSHVNFVTSFARLQCNLCRVEIPADVLNATKSAMTSYKNDGCDAISSVQQLVKDNAFQSKLATIIKQKFGESAPAINPIDFDKDIDSHIDFIDSATSIRCCMFELESIDRWGIKRIAGQIVPAIATTTALVAALQTIQLTNIIQAKSTSHGNGANMLCTFRNTFLNLALPSIVFSEPAAPTKITVTLGNYRTLWDKDVMILEEKYSLQQFINDLEVKYSGKVTMVSQGDKSIYLRMMPNHKEDSPIEQVENNDNGTLNVKLIIKP